MPPKKKQRKKLPLPKQFGKKRQYLADNFNALPDDPTDLKNGHVLLLYITKEKSPTQTITAIREKYSCKCVRVQLQSLLNRESKFSRKSNAETVMKRYETCCEETFEVKEQDDPNAPGQSSNGKHKYSQDFQVYSVYM